MERERESSPSTLGKNVQSLLFLPVAGRTVKEKEVDWQDGDHQFLLLLRVNRQISTLLFYHRRLLYPRPFLFLSFSPSPDVIQQLLYTSRFPLFWRVTSTKKREKQKKKKQDGSTHQRPPILLFHFQFVYNDDGRTDGRAG